MSIALGSAHGKIILDPRGVKQGVGVANRALGTIGGTARKAGLALAAGIGVGVGALTAFGVSSIRVGSEFQEQMKILSVAAGGVELKPLHDASLLMGSDTALIGINASQSADALTTMYKAGLTTSEVFGDLNGYLAGTAELSGAVRAAVDLQAASELDLAAASDAVIVGMKTFGLSGEDATRVANSFVQSADASVASVADLTAAMTTIGPTAAAFGFSIEETNTALAILSTRGIKGSEAGTALKSALVNMMRTTPKVTGALKDLNVSLYDGDGNMRSMSDIIGQLQGGMKGLAEEQKNQYVQTLAGSFGMKALNTLLAEGVEGWEDMEGAIADAATMQDVAAARTNTLKGRWEAFQGTLETVKIKAFEAVQDGLMKLLEWAAEFVNRHGDKIVAVFRAIADWLGRNVPRAVGVVMAILRKFREIWPDIRAAVVPVIERISTIIKDVLWPALRRVFDFIMEHKEAVAGAFIAIGAAITAAGIAKKIQGIATIIGALSSPIGIIVGAVALLGAAWAEDWGGIRATVKEMWSKIEPIFKKVVGWLEENLPKAIEFLVGVWEKMRPGVEKIWKAIVGVIESAVGLIESIWNAFIVPFIEWVQKNWDNIKKIIEAVWNGIAIAIETALNVIKGIFDFFAAIFSGDWEAAWEAIKSVVESIWNGIVAAWDNFWGIIGTVFETVKAGIETAWGNFWGGLNAIYDGISSQIQEAWDGFWGGIAATIENLKAGIEEAWNNFWGGIQTAVETIWDALKLAWDGFWAGISVTIEAFRSGVETAWNNFWSGISSVAQGVIDGITGFVNGLISTIERAIRTLEDLAAAAALAAGGDPLDFARRARNEQSREGVNAAGATDRSDQAERAAAAGFKHGADITIPLGNANDKFFLPMWLSSRERLLVLTPEQQRKAQGGRAVQYVDNSVIHVNDRLAAEMFFENKRRADLARIEERMG